MRVRASTDVYLSYKYLLQTTVVAALHRGKAVGLKRPPPIINNNMSSTWSSSIGKFPKKDPNHGKLWKQIKHLCCKVGLCNKHKCKCDCHK